MNGLAISRSDFLSRLYIRLTFPNISMVITFIAPAQKVGWASKTPGSVLNRHSLQKWVSFQSASTPGTWGSIFGVNTSVHGAWRVGGGHGNAARYQCKICFGCGL